MPDVQIVFMIAVVVVFNIPTKIYRLVRFAWHWYRFKFMFHYVEYSYRGYKYHTRRSGPLNDLEGVGLLLQVKSRGGKILVHISGTKDFVRQYINTRADEIADRNGILIESNDY